MYTNADDWIDKRLSEAQGVRKPAVTDAVATRITILLKGKLGEAPLTAKELADTAKGLLDDMAPPVAPEQQGNHEN